MTIVPLASGLPTVQPEFHVPYLLCCVARHPLSYLMCASACSYHRVCYCIASVVFRTKQFSNFRLSRLDQRFCWPSNTYVYASIPSLRCLNNVSFTVTPAVVPISSGAATAADAGVGVGATAEAEEAGAAAAEATTVPSAPTTVKAERPARAPAEATGAAAAAGDHGFDFDSTINQLCWAYFSSSLLHVRGSEMDCCPTNGTFL